MRYSISVIIPIFNEEKNILHVLDVVTRSSFITEVICINDGSTDNSLQILQKVKGIKLITLEKNYGKAYAVATGIRIAKGAIVILLDGDLHGLTEESLRLLTEPLIKNTYEAVIGYQSKVGEKVFKPLSGQRAYFRKDLLPLVDTMQEKGYGLELYLNFVFRYRRVKGIVIPGMVHMAKHKKHPFLTALRWYVSEGKELLSEIFLQEDPFSYFLHTYIFPFYLKKKITRVLFVFDSVSPIGGGSQIAAFTWIKHLQKHGIVVKILCNSNAKDFVKEVTQENHIGLPHLNLHKLLPHYYPTFWLTPSAKREIISFAPDIIHFHEATIYASQIIAFAKKHNIPTIFHMHTDLSTQTTKRFPLSLFLGKEKAGGKLLSWWQYRLFKQVDYITVSSKQYRKIVFEAIRKKAYVLRLPIQQAFYRKHTPQNAGKTNLLIISRIMENKHIDVLIRMMSYLDDTFHLTLVGDGPDKKTVYDLIKKLKLQQRVTAIDWMELSKLPALMASADLFLSASDCETFGLTYIAALASRTPCMVYDYEISREVIPADTSVFLKTLDPKAWADAIVSLRNNPEQYQQLQKAIEANYGMLKQYSEENSAKELVTFYKFVKRKKIKPE